jgi:hypothetical protein
MADKYTPQTERTATASINASWNGGAAPTAVSVQGQFSRNLVHDDNPNDVIERASGAIAFDGLRTDRSVQVGGGPTLTFRQVSLYFLSMINYQRLNPEA